MSNSDNNSAFSFAIMIQMQLDPRLFHSATFYSARFISYDILCRPQVMDMSVTQPLLVTVSRAGLGSGAAPSPVIPMDTGHPQLRGVVPQTAAVQPPSAPTNSQSHLHGIRLETSAMTSGGLLQPITDQCFRPQFGIASVPMSAGCSASNAASLRFAADTVTAGITKTTAPLDILVSADIGMGKVRHMSPDIAQGLMQSSEYQLCQDL
jgi:hypothetical protein